MVTANGMQPGFGSSPQARGTLTWGVLREGYGRFIPAGAGNTRSRRCRAVCQAVHPRRRGEHRIGEGRAGLSGGSSPQARGTPITITFPHLSHRFIPAGAGNTLLVIERVISDPVHPRRRGEHDEAAAIQAEIDGSSPQARGTLVHRAVGGDGVRFIPAGAGNTPAMGRARPYPSGSSPQARGTPLSETA